MQSRWESKTDAERADALARFFAGTASPDERTDISAWAAATAGNADAAEALRALWPEVIPMANGELAEGWDVIASRMGAGAATASHVASHSRSSATVESHDRVSSSSPIRSRRVPRWTRVAIAGVLAASATVAIAIAAHVRVPTLSGTTAYAVYTTRPGQRATIDLKDGSRVLLNVASTLEVPRNFGANNRAVRLTGQAVFDVTHTTTQPFTVDAMGTRTTVLGTSFGVRAYDPNVRVAVKSGKVRVGTCETIGNEDGCRRDDEHAVLDAGDVAGVNATGRMRVVHNSDLDGDFAFTSNRLMLSGAPLATAIADLDRWYDADIRIADPSVGALVLEGSFPGGNLDVLVQSLEVVLPVRVEREGRVITVYSATEGQE